MNICYLDLKIRHIALSTIIHTCPRSVVKSTYWGIQHANLVHFWLLKINVDFLALIQILVILPKWDNVFRTQICTAICVAGYIYLYGITFLE